MTVYIAKITETGGSSTVAAWPRTSASGQEVIDRAIQSGTIREPGRYVVAMPSGSILNLSEYDVAPIEDPPPLKATRRRAA